MRIVVTGGASGLGESITRRLCRGGHTVLFTFCNSKANAGEIIREFPNARAVRCDFSSESDIANLTEEIRNFNPDGLVNNAINGQIPTIHFHKMEAAQFEDRFRNNVVPVIRITRTALDIFRANKHGRIVTILSSYGFTDIPTGLSAYVAEKNYLWSLCKSWAIENAKSGITSNCVSPTFMLTPQNINVDTRVIENMIANHPAKRLVTPEEVAEIVVQLLQKGPEVNGTNTIVDASD